MVARLRPEDSLRLLIRSKEPGRVHHLINTRTLRQKHYGALCLKGVRVALPYVDRADTWRAGSALNDLSFQHNLQILLLPIAWHLAQHLTHPALVYQKFSRSHRTAPTDAGSYNHVLLGVGIHESRHDRVVLINPCLQLE